MIKFFIIGGQRCGTQSFFSYLSQHPFMMAGVPTSSGFFDEDYTKGIEWYQKEFARLNDFPLDDIPSEHLLGECSPGYLYHPYVCERIKRTCPEAKFIVLLRNPTDRAYSHYLYATHLGHEKLKFTFALKMEPKRLERGAFLMRDNPFHHSKNHDLYAYVSHGFYARFLRRWLDVFPRERFLILRSEEFFAEPVAEAIRAYQFLGLPEFTPQYMDPPRESPYEVLTESTRAFVNRIFTTPNEDLCRLLRWDQSW